MESSPIDRLTLNVALAGVVLTVIVGAVGGLSPALGALAGAILATVNFMGLRWLLGRIVEGPPNGRRGAAVMLALKMSLVLATVWFLLVRLELHPIGFAVGVSALFVGFGMGSAKLIASANAQEES